MDLQGTAWNLMRKRKAVYLKHAQHVVEDDWIGELAIDRW